MDLFLTNTLSRKKEKFVPLDPAHVRMYVCGPTVYDFAHIGNARPVVVFDTLYRLLKRHFPRVTYVRNITDIDDKILARAKETGEPIDSITKRTADAYHQDMAALNALPPDLEPRATQHIPQMLAMIETLIKTGHAYAAEGHVLFNVPSMKNYGELSRRSRDELVAGARVDVAPYKNDPADFVLWKPSAADQPGWDSPWGHGRPGWHIECSAMSAAHLGTTFDIHGGGLDLIFPHHENEIAQSRCAHDGAPLAKYWVHNGFLEIGGDKMSKSLGNFFTVRQLLAKYPGEVIRLALLSAHYRQPLDFSESTLENAKAKLDKWYGALRMFRHEECTPGKPSVEFEKALLDDLNTPLAISYIDKIVKHVHGIRISGNASIPPGDASFKCELLSAGQALGLLRQDPETWFKWVPDAEIDPLVLKRKDARSTKNFSEADRIRKKLANMGVEVKDTPTGPSPVRIDNWVEMTIVQSNSAYRSKSFAEALRLRKILEDMGIELKGTNGKLSWAKETNKTFYKYYFWIALIILALNVLLFFEQNNSFLSHIIR